MAINYDVLPKVSSTEQGSPDELYAAAKEFVAPVIAGFADRLLKDAGDRQIIFAARDGLGSFLAATALKAKFAYGNADPSQLIYANLTRKTLYNNTPDELKRHLKEEGLHDTQQGVLLADIGMYGSTFHGLRAVVPNVEPRYLISKNHSIDGYASSPYDEMNSLWYVSRNPAIHFLEDTFSGPTTSPRLLVERDGKLIADTAEIAYTGEVAAKREQAIKAIYDYTVELECPPEQPASTEIERLDTFLADPANFSHLMVPHER